MAKQYSPLFINAKYLLISKIQNLLNNHNKHCNQYVGTNITYDTQKNVLYKNTVNTMKTLVD